MSQNVVGRSRSAVTNTLRLLGLSDGAKALLRSGAISAGHARALLALTPERRDSVAERIVRDGLTVRAVEEARAAGDPHAQSSGARAAYDAFER